MATFYHGSSRLFEKFDLSHATEGDGKVKFGYGVYVTSEWKSAQHYAFCGAGKDATEHYVYTVEVPEVNPDNCLYYKKPVSESIIARVYKEMNVKIQSVTLFVKQKFINL